jgi:hypothetical protein
VGEYTPNWIEHLYCCLPSGALVACPKNESAASRADELIEFVTIE